MARFSIFGSTGLIGGALVRELVNQGHEVHMPQIRDGMITKENLGNVVYCIGITTDFVSQVDSLIDSHVGLASVILSQSRYESFLYLSSTRIYEGMSETLENGDIAVSVQGLSSFYNLTKLLGESLVLNRSNKRGRIARLSYVIDDMQLIGKDPISNVMSRNSGETVFLPYHQDSQKDYVFLSEVVNTLIQIALYGRRQIYNVASGVNISFDQIRCLSKEYLGIGVELDDTENVRRNPQVNIDAIKQEFDFSSKEIEMYFKEKGLEKHA
jgi:nucleoside-diphosphate-sugar epimerase